MEAPEAAEAAQGAGDGVQYVQEEEADAVALEPEYRNMELGRLSGSAEEVYPILGAFGAKIPKANEVIVTAFGSHLGASAFGAHKAPAMYSAGTDCFIKFPFGRWDHDLYYHPDPIKGLAVVQHCALVQDKDLFAFANDFFGVPWEDARVMTPSNWMAIETGYEALHMAGWTMETLKGSDIDIAIGSCTREGELGERFQGITGPWGLDTLDHNMVSYIFGTQGRSVLIDTACSASNVAFQVCYHEMRTQRDAQKHRKILPSTQSTKALVSGGQWYNSPVGFIGLSQAHMLGPTGRSKTYDMSANGYARGEGWSSLYMKRRDADAEDDGLDAKMTVLGGFINQDGRSASLTAPSGPSQTAVVRGSLRDARREACDVTFSEMHGTGTALGDPIETGSLRACMIADRTIPLLHQAGKTYTGHLELGAGATGYIKTLLALELGIGFAQVHLRELNSHVEDAGYPALWPTEMTDTHRNLMHVGISSFGFGGTNSRCDLWSSVRKGHRKVGPVALQTSGAVATLMDATRLANLDLPSHCYKSDYQIEALDQPVASMDPFHTVHIVGTWNGWTEGQAMTADDEGVYSHTLKLGDTRVEEFRFVIDGDSSRQLYPVVAKAPAFARIEGPDGASRGRSWLIDARDEALLPDTAFLIELRWGDDGPRVAWAAVAAPAAKEPKALALTEQPQQRSGPATKVVLAGPQFQHGFAVVGSWSGWKMMDMVKSSAEPDLWEYAFKVGINQVEEFQFVRDRTFSQAIYPAGLRVLDPSVPILGPDDQGTGKNWMVVGVPGEFVKIQLRVFDGSIMVTTMQMSSGEKVWQTPRFVRP